MTRIRFAVPLILLAIVVACSPVENPAADIVNVPDDSSETSADLVDDHAHDENGNHVSDEDPAQAVDQPLQGDDTCGDVTTIFGLYADKLIVTCDDEYLYVETATGLPDHELMRGITAWILRVPIPFEYLGRTAWRIPRSPVWLDEHAATHSRGPVAMAVNGVPIYHYDKRPDVDLGSSYHYEAKFDTVVQGELDHCGGHAGQGEDYHYHLAPICLLDEHDLAQPIAFTLGGAFIYYGTGADDYYGEGRYSDINNLPDLPLDECNAVQNEDGSYTYYTTAQPPYVVGCHHAAVDWRMQIEPRVMRELTQFGRDATEILSLTTEGEVRTLLFRTDKGQLQAIVYWPSTAGENCWDMEFRTDADVPSTIETHCRVE